MLIQFISYGNINIIKIDAEPKKKKKEFWTHIEGTRGVLRTLPRLVSRAAYFHICC